MRKALLLSMLVALPLLAGEKDSFLLRNATVYTVSGPKIANGSVLVIDGKIAEVGARVNPRGKVRVIDAKGLNVYPGLIDAGTVVGIAEVSSVRETADTGEVGKFNPQLRTSVVVNPESDHIPVTRANGITNVVLLPGGSGGGRFGSNEPSYITGQASLMHLDGWTWEEMLVTHAAAMQLDLPSIQVSRFNPQSMQVERGNYQESKRNQERGLMEIRAFFEEARRYQTAKQAKAADFRTDLKFEAMLPVLEGKLPLMIPAVRERDIRDAIEFSDKEKVKIVLSGVRKPGDMLETIAKKKIPVVLPSPYSAPLEEDDAYDSTYTLASELQKAGVKFAFGSFGAQFARNLPYEAGQSIAFGLPYDEGLKAVTLNAAEILGVSDRLGSIDAGKIANLIVTDGDPLDIRTQVKMMFVKGQSVDLESKHTRLWKKYLARP